MSRARGIAAALALLLLGPPAAHAHALLREAVPRVGSTVQAPPGEVRLQFSEKIDGSASELRVLDAAGRRVERGAAHADPEDRTTLVVGLEPIRPGTYRVEWRAVSLDGHVTKGDFTFAFAPDGPD